MLTCTWIFYVSLLDDPPEDAFKIKQETPSCDDSFDQEGVSPSVPVPDQAVFPTAKVSSLFLRFTVSTGTQ